MKKMVLALLMGLCFIGMYGQADPVVRSVRFEAQSEAEMNAIPANKLQEGSVCYREDTDSLWRYNGSAWAEISGGSATTDASDLTTGVLADARVQESNVTQHEGALTITESQISDLGTYIPTTDIIDEDNMVSDSNTKVPTQQSVKAYVDANSGSGDLWSDPVDSDIVPDTDDTYDLGSISYVFTSAFLRNAYFKDISATNINYFLGISANGLTVWEEAGQDTGSYNTIYTFGEGGVPSAATDLIDKAYADANYSSGSGDVTAASNFGTDNVLIRADGTTKGVQSSGITISDTDQIIGFETLVGGDTPWYFGEDEGASGRRWKLDKAGGSSTEGLRIQYQSSDATTYNGASYSTIATINESGTPTETTDLIPKAYADANYGGGTDDQTAAEVNITDSGSFYTGTNVEDALQEVGDSIAVQITSDITGVTGGTAIKNMYLQTEVGQDTDGTPPAGVASLCIDCSPAKVVATATIAMDGWKMYDDQSTDAATITLSDCDPGETLTVYINRASAPTLAGTGLTFNQLPNTDAFTSATQMAIEFRVTSLIESTNIVVDYFYVER